MDEIKILHKSTFLGKEIDVWGTFENPLFRASDVANWLHNTNVSNMVKKVDEDEVTKFNLGSRQGETLFLTENGLYEILMLSRKKDAKQFKKGVKKILHEIRTKGGYIASTDADTPEDIMARAVLVAQQTLARREERIKELEEQGRRQEIVIEQKDAQIDAQDKQIKIAAPKADYYDKTLASKSCMTTTQVADDLHTTAHTLNRKLQEIGIIYSQSGQWHLKMPYKKWNLAGTRTYNYQSSNGEVVTKVTLVWNQRGKRFILALYNNNFDVKQAIAEIKGDISNK